MGVIRDISRNCRDSFFNYGSWSYRKRLGFLATALYSASLWGFIASEHLRDRRLAKEFEQRNAAIKVEYVDDSRFTKVTVVEDSKEIFSYTYGGRPFHRYLDRYAGFFYVDMRKIGRVGAEDSIEKLLEYRSRGHKKFIFSYSVPLTSVSLAYFVHPIALLALPATGYLNLNGETETFPAQEKLDTLAKKKSPTLEGEIDILQNALRFKQTEPDPRQGVWALYTFFLIPLAASGYWFPRLISNATKFVYKSSPELIEDSELMRKLNIYIDKFTGKRSTISIAIPASMALLIASMGMPHAIFDPRPKEEAQIRYELGEKLRVKGNLEEAILQLSQSIKLDSSLSAKLTKEQKELLNLN